MVSLIHLANFHTLPLKSVIPNFVACLVFLGIAFSFMQLLFSSDTSTKGGEARGSHFEKIVLPNMTPFSADDSNIKCLKVHVR